MFITAYDVKDVLKLDELLKVGDDATDVWCSERRRGVRVREGRGGELVCQLVRVSELGERFPYGHKFTVVAEHLGQLPAYFPRAWDAPAALHKF